MADKTEGNGNCFVVSPIGAEGSEEREHADWLFNDIISPVLKDEYKGRFNVVRSDKIHTPGMIDAQIINHLLNDELVIADMTGLNPNVFYEIGIRHMAFKPVIHMFKAGEKIPFDVGSYRAIPFDYANSRALKDAKVSLAKALHDVLSEDHIVDNPIMRASSHRQSEIKSSPQLDMIGDHIKSMYHLLNLIIEREDNKSGSDQAIIASSVASQHWRVSAGPFVTRFCVLDVDNDFQDESVMFDLVSLITSKADHLGVGVEVKIVNKRIYVNAISGDKSTMRELVIMLSELPLISKFSEH